LKEAIKKDLSPQREPRRFSWDKSLKLLRCHPNWRFLARSATCHHTPFLGNGGKTRRCLLAVAFSPPSAVHSAVLCSAALSLPATRWESIHALTRLPHRFFLSGFGSSINRSPRPCQAAIFKSRRFVKKRKKRGGERGKSCIKRGDAPAASSAAGLLRARTRFESLPDQRGKRGGDNLHQKRGGISTGAALDAVWTRRYNKTIPGCPEGKRLNTRLPKRAQSERREFAWRIPHESNSSMREH